MGASRLMDRSLADSTTRTELVNTALKHFAEHGFDAASIRAIVGEAGQNNASIKYHFGSKAGLYDACVRAVAERLKVKGPGAALKQYYRDPERLTATEARHTIRNIIAWTIRDSFEPTSRLHAAFLHREILTGGRAADLFLTEVMRAHIDIMATLVATAEDLPHGSAGARLRAVGLIGQTVFFLTADTLTSKAMGWDRLDDRIPDLLDAIYPETQGSGDSA